VTVVIDHDPVAGAPELVRVRRIREEAPERHARTRWTSAP
jgi:hypothetical protein